jgi:hypothetical protein
MLKPIEKPSRQSLVHHPSDVLDSFGHYDSTSVTWIEFNESLSEQLRQFELGHPQYIRVRPQFDRRSSGV